MKKPGRAIRRALLLVLTAAALSADSRWHLQLSEVSLRFPSLPPALDGYRIVQLSDLHSKPFKKALEKTRALRPDVIVITGDYIRDRNPRKDTMLEYGRALCEVAPVYYITGNHERRLDSFEELMQELREIGFHVLLNETAQLTVGENTLSLLGLDENQADFKDYRARKNGTFEYPDMSDYLHRLESMDGYKIVLTHFPENFEGLEAMHYSRYDFDLQLSGHAHGGQFILPLIGPVFSPGQGIHPKYARGTFGERPRLIVSRGIGNSEFPFRLFNHPEIIYITISRKLS